MASSSGLDFVSDRQKRRRINFALLARELDGPVGQDYQSSLENITDNENENLQTINENNGLYEDADVYHNRTEIVNDVSNVSDSDIEPESDGDEYFYDCEVEETFFDCQEDVRLEVDGIERANDFQKLLAAWAVDCQVKQVHVDKLLSVFKLFPNVDIFTRLPSTCRTLLSTTRKTCLKTIEPGHYFHFGIEEGVRSMLRKLGIKRLRGKKLKLQINVDGIPISKSLGRQFWPILGYLTDFPHSKPFLIGIYHGYSKPNDANFFLSEFVLEMYDGRLIFLDDDSPLRTDTSFRNREDEDHHTGRSILQDLPIDMVKCFPLDYMHLVCLGVMRKLLWAWKRGSYQSRLRASEIDEISKFLVFICPFISCELARKTRSVKELARWKATELRLFLLYVGN